MYRRENIMAKQRFIRRMGIMLLFLIPILTVMARASDAEGFLYQAADGNVCFECRIEAPSGAMENGLQENVLVERRFQDAQVVKERFGQGRQISEEHMMKASGQYPAEMIWEYEDGSMIRGGRWMSWSSSQGGWYSTLAVVGDACGIDTQEELAFASSDECIQLVIQAMQDVGIKDGEFSWTVYSFDQNQLRQLQDERIQYRLMDAKRVRKNISEEDEAYVICGWQVNQEIPVFSEFRGMYQNFASDARENASIQAVVTERGIEILSVLNYYVFQEGFKKYVLLPFEKVAERISLKYNRLLGDITWNVTGAKLFQMVLMNEKQELEVKTAWRFELTGTDGSFRITMIDAQSGEDISPWGY